jgi:hypothetical protein
MCPPCHIIVCWASDVLMIPVVDLRRPKSFAPKATIGTLSYHAGSLLPKMSQGSAALLVRPCKRCEGVLQVLSQNEVSSKYMRGGE